MGNLRGIWRTKVFTAVQVDDAKAKASQVVHGCGFANADILVQRIRTRPIREQLDSRRALLQASQAGLFDSVDSLAHVRVSGLDCVDDLEKEGARHSESTAESILVVDRISAKVVAHEIIVAGRGVAVDIGGSAGP